MIKRLSIIFLMVFALAACSTQPKFETQEDYIGAALATIDGVTKTVIQYYQYGLISKEEAQKYATELDKAFLLTKSAELMSIGELEGDPLVILQRVNEILFKLQAELKRRMEQ